MIVNGATIAEKVLHVLRQNRNRPMMWIRVYKILREHDDTINPESVSRCLRDLKRKNPNVKGTRTRGEYVFKLEDTNSKKLDDYLGGNIP